MLDVVMQRIVQRPVLDVDMSRVALPAWAEALRVQAFVLQRLLIPGTEPADYLTGARALLAHRAHRSRRSRMVSDD